MHANLQLLMASVLKVFSMYAINRTHTAELVEHTCVSLTSQVARKSIWSYIASYSYSAVYDIQLTAM